jgi:2-(1,2-epoxy-1,2-dihydrophenyl)acetyl-CoA isomerase
MSEKAVLLEVAEGIGTISLNRPAAMNSIDRTFVDDLMTLLDLVQKDDRVRCVVITGNGKAFSAGGDLNYLQGLKDPAEFRSFIAEVGQLAATIINMKKPFVAMVNGVAAGAGFNLALACDLIVCAKSARFAQSFVKVGLIPDFAGAFLLPRIIGLPKAKELAFTADLITAETAESLGLVNYVIPDEQLKEETYKLAGRLAVSAPIAIGLAKKMLNCSMEWDLATLLAHEADYQTVCMQTADYREGVNAFREKRQPAFTGK